MMTFALCLIAFLVPSSAIAQGISESTFSFLDAVKNAQSSLDVNNYLMDENPAMESIVLWEEALKMASQALEEPAVRRSLVRVMEAALLIDGSKPDNLSLEQLHDADLNAMKSAVRFPDPGDLIQYLLMRSPSVEASYSRSTYSIIRIYDSETQTAMVRESSSVPLPSVSNIWREVGPGLDGIRVEAKERAKTRRINLSAVPYIVVAAKAFRAASRSNSKNKVYPLLIAAEAVDHAFHAFSTDFRSVLFLSTNIAAKSLKAYSGDSSLIANFLEEYKSRVPRVSFDARYFKSAELAYQDSDFGNNTTRAKAWSQFWSFISRFAYGEADEGDVIYLLQHLNEETPEYSTLLFLLLTYISPIDAKELGFKNDWRVELLGYLELIGLDLSSSLVKKIEGSFLFAMYNIGRPDIAARYTIDRILALDQDGDEREYLLKLAAQTREFCYLISFEMSEESAWIRRDTQGYHYKLDFLDNINADGELSSAGEVLPLDPENTSYVPYPTIDPEEDCASVSVAYGVVPRLFDTILPATPENSRNKIVKGVEIWVDHAMNRKYSAPSLAPFLKLVWMEWFPFAFETLRSDAVTSSAFKYKPLDASSMTSKEIVRKVREKKPASDHQQYLADVFLTTREFLESRY